MTPVAAWNASPADDHFDPNGKRLLNAAIALSKRDATALAIISVNLEGLQNDSELVATVLAGTVADPGARRALLALIKEVFGRHPDIMAFTMFDAAVSADLSMEPGGDIAALLYARGVHAILAHRIAHALWTEGRKEAAFAVRAVFGRAFSTDIHPGARFGKGVWLDHGLSFVVGESAVIEDDVRIWHGVTLGSTLKDGSPERHPRLRRGCTIGADAIILGGIDVGEGSVVAAGSIVLTPVPPHTTVAGVPARQRPRTAASFSGL